MDIQISSNLERLLFELLANGPARRTADRLRATGAPRFGPNNAELIAGFAGGRLDDSETLDVIRTSARQECLSNPTRRLASASPDVSVVPTKRS